MNKISSGSTERDYVLGTHDEEIARLGLQHRVWRSCALEAWRKAGITIGSHVLDIGAGPGYATIDLAEIVGPSGRVVAVERSRRFLDYAKTMCTACGLTNVLFHEADIMTDAPGMNGMDAVWCRWVASFVPSPAKLIQVLRDSLRSGGVAIFHEYVDYGTWRLAPRKPAFESFVSEVMESWRAAGGEPDVALSLPGLLQQSGFSIRSLEPIVFAITPRNYTWQWPAAFVETGLQRLLDLGRVYSSWVESVRAEFKQAESDPTTVMITPAVLEIIADRS
jgi:SAM-dependent methyltransferase